METLLLISIAAYLVLMFGIALWAKGKISNEADFIVAGRRLSTPLASASLLATWFGAGTLLTATDEVRMRGVYTTALEPYGAGICLILAGFFIAKPLYRMNILTLADFFKKKFGARAEALSVIIPAPGYLGWIAAQMVAAAGIIELFFGLPLVWGILIMCIVATAYTMIGGMWSVTMTDAAQLAFIFVGVILIGYTVFAAMGNGNPLEGTLLTLRSTPADQLQLIPTESLSRFFGWMTVFMVGALGNLPGQDLTQRIFASRSEKVAKQSCFLAGILYCALGTIPVLLGLAAKQLLSPEITHSVLPALAKMFLSPSLTIIFVLALLSVILSTMDSAILAVASPLSHNVLKKMAPFKKHDMVSLCQYCVLLVAVLSLIVAYSGSGAYELLETAYASSLVTLFVPLMMGIYTDLHSERACISSMAVGLIIWCLEFITDFEFPFTILALVSSFAVYWTVAKLKPTASKLHEPVVSVKTAPR